MWQERAWSKRDDREMTFSVRKSSAGRWDGFEAILYEASAGFSEQQFVRHNVSMQIGKPLLVTSRCNGETLRRLQVPGDVKIVPPGVPRIWETESATTKLSMYLNSTLMLSTAAAMGIDLERIAIRPQLHLRDPRIEHVGWAVNAELETPEPLGAFTAKASAWHWRRTFCEPTVRRARSLRTRVCRSAASPACSISSARTSQAISR